MNDIDLLRQWHAAQVSSETPSAQVRVRALTGQAPRRRAKSPRLAWSVGLSAGLAVVVVGGVAWSQDPPGSGAQGGTGPASAQSAVTGAQVLRDAAMVVPQGATAPRANQFVYVKQVTLGAAGPAGAQDGGADGAQLRQVWRSVDGGRDGVLKGGPLKGTGAQFTSAVPACRDGRVAKVGPDGTVVPGEYESMPCQPNPEYLPNLPTNPGDMSKWLRDPKAIANGAAQADGSGAGGAQSDVVAFNDAVNLLDNYYLTGPQESALFEALAQLPGLTVRDKATDLAGRQGIAVFPPSAVPATTKPAPGVAPTAAPQAKVPDLIFDRHSHAFLGSAMFATLDTAIVDNAGQLPS
ncbi:hypothetical protein GCM10023322_42810 [Rugosimonospora acidiphila]|uniref:CU044_5270 family protein n=1 Tax=Rugosimonospora acidiphila TaxID=556531 RepID=A0ABP9S285_9ACTN